MADQEKAKSAPKDRVVRAFISSPFRDMQNIENYLAKYILQIQPSRRQ